MFFPVLAQAAEDYSSSAPANLGGFLSVFLVLIVAFGLASFVFWIWMIADCATNKSLDGTEKIIWLLVVIFLHLLGALIYFFAGRKKGAAV